MLLLNQEVDSVPFHVPPPFKAPSGGRLGKPPADDVKGGRVSSGSAPFLSSISEAIREVSLLK
jgi:hypothetical protein